MARRWPWHVSERCFSVVQFRSFETRQPEAQTSSAIAPVNALHGEMAHTLVKAHSAISAEVLAEMRGYLECWQ